MENNRPVINGKKQTTIFGLFCCGRNFARYTLVPRPSWMKYPEVRALLSHSKIASHKNARTQFLLTLSAYFMPKLVSSGTVCVLPSYYSCSFSSVVEGRSVAKPSPVLSGVWDRCLISEDSILSTNGKPAM